MCSIRTAVIISATLIAAGAVWQAKGVAQENAASDAGVVTVFDHARLDASFANALAKGGTATLWSRTSTYGTSEVSVHSRESIASACRPQGCSHKGYTAVVIVTSGAATLEVGGTARAGGTSKFGGQLVQGGESHRISQGDVFIMPPDTIHWYNNVAAPFHYIEVPVP